MATQITQQDDGDTTVLRVEGEMLVDDAKLLEKIAVDMEQTLGKQIVIDLADLDFLDSDSAAVLRKMQELRGYKITGMEIFLQTAINDAEKSGR